MIRHYFEKIANVNLIIFILLIVGCNRQTFVQKANSMNPTIKPGEKVYVDMSAYANNTPQRWDVILFQPPAQYENKGVWTFRVVGLPGEIISFNNLGLLINGKNPQKPLSLSNVSYTSAPQNQFSSLIPYIVPENSYFVLGDNSAIANDSRMWGAISKKKILGKVLNK